MLPVNRQPPRGNVTLRPCNTIQNGRPQAFVPASLSFPSPCIQKVFQNPATATRSALILLPFVAGGFTTRRPIGQGLSAGRGNLRSDCGKNALNRLIRSQPGCPG